MVWSASVYFFAMRADYSEEEPVIHKVEREAWIMNVYNIGIVEWKRAPFIVASPDGVAEFCADNLTHHACIEIKTRTDSTEIEDAEEAAEKHGTTVHCTFGDDVFHDCVPAGDRQQLLQQAIVTSFEYGIFVTAKGEMGDEESIVQIVVVKIRASDKHKVSESMLKMGDELVGWLHEPAVMAGGYLMDSDFPEWLPNASDEAKVIKSQYRLWIANIKRSEPTASRTSPPVLLIHTSTRYNTYTTKQKWDRTSITRPATTFLSTSKLLSRLDMSFG